MTTIAWDGERLAADTQATCGNGIGGYVSKLLRLADGTLCGFAGDTRLQITFFNWLKSECEGKPDIPEDCDFSAIVVTGSEVRLYEDGAHYLVFRRHEPKAIGSGWQFAISAMDFGQNACQAIEYAMRRDCFTGGKVEVLEVCDAVL